MVPPLSSWPWENFGVYKYVLYGPLVANVIHSKSWEGEGKDLWCLHLLILCGLRGLVFTFWSSFSNMLFLNRRRRILQDGVGFKQIDAEWDWDNGLMLHRLMGALTCYFFPNLKSTPLWNSWGLPLSLAIHALIYEPLFYLFHKIFHSDYFFKDYHAIHHSSPVPQPFTELVIIGVVMGVPILGCFLIRVGSAGLVYVYVLMFDFLRCMGHSNVEVFPSGLFESFPFMRYLIYTPTDGIIRADKIGVKVISVGALNKNEALNGGGTLFVNKHPDLNIRVVHGNMLTAAVILNEIPKDVEEVFLTGATSKLGRAIALYLCRKKIRVLMLTLSSERFQKIQKEAPADYQPYLVQVTKYQAAQNCKTGIVGKWIKPKEQNCAPAGTHFHQFVVPPISSLRRDCTYGKLAAMRLPEDVEGN